MNRYSSTGAKFKIFVKEISAEVECEKSGTKIKPLSIASLTGKEAKEYYENILKETSSVSFKEKQPLMKPKHRIVTKPAAAKLVQNKIFKNADLLWMAQNNDVKNLNVFFAQNKAHDVNIVDDFGWTPLMCASCSGAEGAVSILLEKGADPHKCDRLGNTALKLARQNNRQNIVKILENIKDEPDVIGDELELEESAEKFFCPTCKENFSINKKKHESSTLHLFNSPQKTSTFYGIPESNKGFQLLLQEGWDKEKGLGPDGKGRKFPIKAVMKKDRTGIGAPPTLNKSKREIEHTEKYESKRRQIYKRWKNKDFERNFRLEFS